MSNKTFSNSSFKVAAIMSPDELQKIYTDVKLMSVTRRFATSSFCSKYEDEVVKYEDKASKAKSVDDCIDAYNHLIDLCVSAGMAEYGETYRKFINDIEAGTATIGDELKPEYVEVMKAIKPVLTEVWACCCELYVLRRTWNINVFSMIQDSVLEAQKELLGDPTPAEEQKPAEQNTVSESVNNNDVPVSDCELYQAAAFYDPAKMNKIIKKAKKLVQNDCGGYEKSAWAKNPISKGFVDDLYDRAQNAATIKELVDIYDETLEVFTQLNFMTNADALKKMLEEGADAKTAEEHKNFTDKYQVEISTMVDVFLKFFMCVIGDDIMQKKFGIKTESFIRASVTAARKKLSKDETTEQSKDPDPKPDSSANIQSVAEQEVQPVQQVETALATTVQPAPQAIAAEAVESSYKPNFSKFVMQTQPEVERHVNFRNISQQTQPVQQVETATAIQPVQNGPKVIGNGTNPMPAEIKRNSWNAKSLENVSFNARMDALNKHIKLFKGQHPGADDITINTLLSVVTSNVVYTVCSKAGIEIPDTGLTFVEIPMATYQNLLTADISNYNIALRSEQVGKDNDPVVVYLNDRALSPMTMEAFTPSFQKRIKAKSSGKKSNKKTTNKPQQQSKQDTTASC